MTRTTPSEWVAPPESTKPPSAAWYPDPVGRYQFRYWDGATWTADAASYGKATTDPLPQGTAVPPMPRVLGADRVVHLDVGPGRAVASATITVPRTNGMAVSSLVLGIVGALAGLIPILALIALPSGILATVFGVVGRRRAAADPAHSGAGMARAGLILGLVAVVLAIIGFVIVSNAVNSLNTGG